jgi:hypothetical protein
MSFLVLVLLHRFARTTWKIACLVMLLVQPGLITFARRIVGAVS